MTDLGWKPWERPDANEMRRQQRRAEEDCLGRDVVDLFPLLALLDRSGQSPLSETWRASPRIPKTAPPPASPEPDDEAEDVFVIAPGRCPKCLGYFTTGCARGLQDPLRRKPCTCKAEG